MLQIISVYLWGDVLEVSISASAIKIACIQTIAGYEGEVKSELTAACETSSEIQDFTILKGFGSFDIILLYLTNDFGPHLRETGPIDYILKSNLLLCYTYLNKNGKQIIDSIKKKLFTSFCLLKIIPSLMKIKPEINTST